jgi:hypothetical protein
MPRRFPVSTHRSGEALVFAGATAVALVHALDDAFAHRGAGVGLGQHAAAALVAVALAVAAVWAFPRLRPAARSAVSLFFGAAALVNGALHLKHIDVLGASGGDYTGVLAFGAGLVLVGLAAAIPWRHRGEGAASPRRRWAIRVAAVPLGLLAFVYTVVPVGMALTETHKFREPVGPPPAGYQEVAFEASDGVALSGWYRPTRNGATVLVVHGGGGDRTGSLAHAQLLARHGYGVLLHDARGRGRSEGTQNSYGWGWDRDVAGAMAFLKSRPEVDPARIGGLGLSTGADVLANAAAERGDLAGVVADGTWAANFEDAVRTTGIGPMTPFFALEFATVKITSGAGAGAVIEESMKRVRSPVLLVAAGEPERRAGELYDRAAGDRPVELWHLPDAGHTAAIREVAPEYERRVTAFFGETLAGVR